MDRSPYKHTDGHLAFEDADVASTTTTKHTLSMINFRENMCCPPVKGFIPPQSPLQRPHHKRLCTYMIFYLYFSTLSDQYARPHTFTPKPMYVQRETITKLHITHTLEEK